ncbi:hypothetical protein WICPIJ_008998 [Wickerhamomyces pijperi]|uniref:Uncharacterized protein n=1 Tax=Wickerhamomyces pijperi TaxID=599730 RepID=A0A9P8TF51_WICPI|nr:hypothetical protein WICPIJ_008998 [Wickerhamomyces pijperi]
MKSTNHTIIQQIKMPSSIESRSKRSLYRSTETRHNQNQSTTEATPSQLKRTQHRSNTGPIHRKKQKSTTTRSGTIDIRDLLRLQGKVLKKEKQQGDISRNVIPELNGGNVNSSDPEDDQDIYHDATDQLPSQSSETTKDQPEIDSDVYLRRKTRTPLQQYQNTKHREHQISQYHKLAIEEDRLARAKSRTKRRSLGTDAELQNTVIDSDLRRRDTGHCGNGKHRDKVVRFDL